ncbi:MAG: FMN-dependent NADH-azoreductase [Planctomycetota bacterium]|jgi:FMN-dependent NADH-azoreductase
MAKVLYIQASPRKERSKSTQVATAFLESYRQSHPNDTVETFNIFEEDLPSFDGLKVQAKYTILHGKEHTPEERQAWDAVERVITHFKAADKYVLSLPMWNFSIPYRLKQYIDILIQPGYTFTANENGYEGLIKGKPITVVYARGGTYVEGTEAEAFDMQKKYIELVLGFMGFQNIYSIVVEPTLQGDSNDIQRISDASIRKAQTLGSDF